MKLSKKLKAILVGSLLTFTFGLMSTGGSVSADCLYQYNANGFNTSTTPVFNSICGVPYGVNNESDFVRIRPTLDGNDENISNDASYTVGTLNSACTTGSKYDLWNYVHNNASQNYNPDVGNGSAVAHGTAINMTAPLGTTSNQFNFGATISANNATSVSDTATLNCGSNQVQLSIVPGTVHIYSEPYGGWQNLNDNVLNSNLPLGSTNAGLSSLGGGDMWGCWNYRILIVYQVQVTSVPSKVVMPTCNLLTLENINGVARIDNIEYTANSATVTGYSVLITSGSTSKTVNLSLNQLPYNYPMTAGNTYNFQATVLTSLGNVTNANCEGSLTVNTPPPTTPTTPVTPAPTQLVNTGPGSVVAIFLGASVLGTLIYQFILKKKLTRN